jgi:prepilin signal peptidase PulO-like enzyme (type II secretory pathway)
MKVNCTTMAFMSGVIIGALIHTENSILNVVSSIVLATVVFHFTSLKDFKFIKKGS